MGKSGGRLVLSLHKDARNFVYSRHYPLPTHSRLVSSANVLRARVNALSFDSLRLLAGSLPSEKGRKSRAVMPALTCTHAACVYRRDSRVYTVGGGSRERESRERICRSEWIRGYGSSNKVITRTQTAGTIVSRDERSSTSRNMFAGKCRTTNRYTCMRVYAIGRTARSR